MKRPLIAFAILMLPVHAYAIGEGATFKGCGSGESSNLFGGFAVLSDVITSGFGDFVQCLDDAYLVEHYINRKNQTAHEIARMYVNSKITRVECTNLSANVLAEAPVSISSERLKIDHNFARSGSERDIAATIAHELAHNLGFRHKSNDFGSTYYGNTVPEQVEACVRSGRPNPWPGPGSAVVNPNNIIGMGIDGENDFVFTWYRDGTVTAGTTDKLHDHRIPALYTLPAGKTPNDIAGMGIDGENDFVFAWYRDGTVSAGTSVNLISRRQPYRYRLPSGKTPNDIVGMGIDGENNFVYAWYRDGTVSAGTSDNLGSRRMPYPYTLPSGKTPNDVVGMGVDGENNFVFAWFRDGTVTAGTTENMLLRRPPYRYQAGR